VNEMTVPSTIREAYVQASSFLAGRGRQASGGTSGGGAPSGETAGSGTSGGGASSGETTGSGTPGIGTSGEASGAAGTREEGGAASGTPGQDPGRAALLLLRALLGCDQGDLILRWHDPFPADQWERWTEWLRRKADGEPVQYITGEAPFCGRLFRVTPAVLVPRPETELLVERVSRIAQEMFGPDGALTAADIGTGSGAIAVTLALLHPHWRVIATDLSPEALEVARANARALGADARMDFVCGDLLEPLARRGVIADVLVSNPPYVPTGEIAGLMPEVRDHEPRLALDGGEDGLDKYRLLVRELPLLPALPRLIGLEVGAGQAEAVAALLAEAARWERIERVRDYSGIERHVIAVR